MSDSKKAPSKKKSEDKKLDRFKQVVEGAAQIKTLLDTQRQKSTAYTPSLPPSQENITARNPSGDQLPDLPASSASDIDDDTAGAVGAFLDAGAAYLSLQSGLEETHVEHTYSQVFKIPRATSTPAPGCHQYELLVGTPISSIKPPPLVEISGLSDNCGITEDDTVKLQTLTFNNTGIMASKENAPEALVSTPKPPPMREVNLSNEEVRQLIQDLEEYRRTVGEYQEKQNKMETQLKSQFEEQEYLKREAARWSQQAQIAEHEIERKDDEIIRKEKQLARLGDLVQHLHKQQSVNDQASVSDTNSDKASADPIGAPTVPIGLPKPAAFSTPTSAGFNVGGFTGGQINNNTGGGMNTNQNLTPQYGGYSMPYPPPQTPTIDPISAQLLTQCASAFEALKVSASSIDKKFNSSAGEANKALTPKPDKFARPTALRSTRQFLEKFVKFCRNAGDLEMFEGLENFLEGEALAVYKHYCNRHPMGSFAGIRDHLLGELKQLDSEERTKTFMHRKQKESESVTDYSREMDLLMCNYDLPEELRAQVFLNGLKPEISQVLIGLPIETVKEAKAKAVERELVVKSESAKSAEVEKKLAETKAEQDSVINMIQNRGPFYSQHNKPQDKSVSFNDQRAARPQTPGGRRSRSGSRNRSSSTHSNGSAGNASGYESDEPYRDHLYKQYVAHKRQRGIRKSRGPYKQQYGGNQQQGGQFPGPQQQGYGYPPFQQQQGFIPYGKQQQQQGFNYPQPAYQQGQQYPNSPNYNSNQGTVYPQAPQAPQNNNVFNGKPASSQSN